MKRVVFILLTLALLLCAEAVTLWATRADASYGSALRAQSLSFFYKKDEKARYLDLKTQWQAERLGEITYPKAAELASEAYDKASVESPFDQWRYQGGPAPNIFTGKIHVYNSGREAMLNVPLQVTLRAKVGALRVNPVIQMTDYDYLNETAQWQGVSQNTVKIAALAPGEDMLVEVARFHLLNFLAKHPNQWPSELEVKVSSPGMAATRNVIPLIPDHFVVPILY